MSRSGVGLPAVTEGTSMSPSLSEGSRFLSFLSLCFFFNNNNNSSSSSKKNIY
jgi:hypothetical protein